jgi:hypothetical protein
LIVRQFAIPAPDRVRDKLLARISYGFPAASFSIIEELTVFLDVAVQLEVLYSGFDREIELVWQVQAVDFGLDPLEIGPLYGATDRQINIRTRSLRTQRS